MKPSRAVVVRVVLGLASVAALARAEARPRFEPADLRLQVPGALAIDTQLGVSRGPGGTRTTAPDIEVSLGVLPNVELNLEAGMSSVVDEGQREYERDPLWPSVKLGLFDVRWENSTFAGGVQLGPRLPSTRKMIGPGYETLALLALMRGRTQLALNIGGIIDPGQDDARRRPYGELVGLDASVTVDDAARWKIVAEVGAAHYRAVYDNEVTATVGMEWAASPSWTLSAISLASPWSTQQRYGVLLGITPMLQVW